MNEAQIRDETEKLLESEALNVFSKKLLQCEKQLNMMQQREKILKDALSDWTLKLDPKCRFTKVHLNEISFEILLESFARLVDDLKPKSEDNIELGQAQQVVFDILKEKPFVQSELLQITGFSAPRLSAILHRLEVLKKIKKEGDLWSVN